jgi:integrase
MAELSKLGRQSNFLAQIDEEVITGGDMKQYLNQKKQQSKAAWRNSCSSLVELKGFLGEQGDTVEEIVSDLMLKVETEKTDITKHVVKLLQGVNDNMMKDRPCYNCKETGSKMVGKNLQKCQSCHGTMIKVTLGAKTRQIYISCITEILRFYGLLNNVNQKNIKIKQPKLLKEKKYALEKKTAMKIVTNANNSMRRTFLKFQCLTGTRLNETIHLKPEHFSYVDNQGKKTSKENMFRMRVDLPAEITKTGVERYCIIHKDIQDEVFKLVNTPTGKTKWQQHDKPNEYVFHTSTSAESGHSNEERSFTFERERMIKDGHEEMALQYMSGRHKITIHSLRSMFITLANRVSGSDLAGDFGDHMAGHTEGGMKALYDRMPENMVMEIWIKAEPLLSMENNATQEMEVMQDEITFLKEQSEQKEKETKQMIQDMQERHIEEMAKQQVAFLEQMEKRFELKKKSK